MKKVLALGLWFVAALGAQATVKIGDTYEAVIAEKGIPTGRMGAGAMLLLRYPDQTIKLKNGIVVALEISQGSTVPSPVHSATPPAKRATTGTAVSTQWTTNFMGALEQAKTQERHVFVFFTGSDWCSWCQRLNREILSTPEFQQYASEKLVLVELDFPKSKPQSPDLAEQNAKLANFFHIKGYPTVIILDSAGKPVGRLGYQEGGPGPFLQKLQSF